VDAEFGREETFELRLNEGTPPTLTLEMNRDEVAALFGDTADQVLLLELDSAALLTNTLEEIKGACGNAWMLNNSDPQHDCSLTALGQTFAGADGRWETSPEYAMVRVLTMTPANVTVEGTSSAAMAGLADSLGIGGGYGQILSEALGISRTATVVPTHALVTAFREDFVASHPAATDAGNLPFYLSDALSDLATMTDRLGPAGDHPGVIDPSFEVHGEVFGPDFRMRAVAGSNLRLVDGLDADAGKGFISVIVDDIGPSYDDEVEFDFADPEKFALEGIIEDLRVDLRFKIFEHDSFVWSCLGSPPCQDNGPDSPVGTGSVWGLAPWSLEYNIVAAARHSYGERTFVGSYAFGAAEVRIGQSPNPPGWIEYDIPFDLGSPPEDQYVWETILEVAQVALHRASFQDFNEGDVDVAFTLRDLPIGITGSQAAEAVRPYLQEQAAQLSDFLLGDYKKNNDHVDVYFRRGEDGQPYLFFVGEAELREGEAYRYARPGFFSSPDLTEQSKVSVTEVLDVSDSWHEKLRVTQGETVVYYEDDEGLTWRARIEQDSADATMIRVHMAPRLD
jgi:hypothetical protein